MHDIEQVILRFREAVLSADATQLARLLSVDLSYGHSDGHVEGKDDLISKLADGTYQFTTMDISQQTVGVTGDLAIIRHELDAATNDEDKPGEAHLFVLLVWQHGPQGWQLVARQAVKKRQ
jgi:ketosteroid isomerase-like protein